MKKSITRYLVTFAAAALVLFYSHGDYWSSTWLSKWTALVTVGSALFAWAFAMRVSYWLLPICLSCLWSGIYLFSWNFNRYHGGDPLFLMSMGKCGAYAFIATVFVMLLVGWTPSLYCRPVMALLANIPVLGALETCWAVINDQRERGGFSGNFSMHGGLLASLSVFWLWGDKSLRWGLLGLLLCFYLLGAVQPWLVFGVAWGAYFVAQGRMRPFILGAASFLLVAVPVWFFVVGHAHFDLDNGRLTLWEHVMPYWWTNGSLLFGYGIGTGPALIPWLQEASQGVDGDVYFFWLHNDWLQVLLEMGFVGLVSAFVAWVWLAMRAWRNPMLFGSFMGLSTLAMFNYPLRLPIHLSCMALVCWLIVSRGSTQLPAVEYK